MTETVFLLTPFPPLIFWMTMHRSSPSAVGVCWLQVKVFPPEVAVCVISQVGSVPTQSARFLPACDAIWITRVAFVQFQLLPGQAEPA